MKQLKLILIQSYLSVFILSACSNKQSFKVENLTDHVWIYNSDSLADSIKNFTDNYLIFDENAVFVNGEYMGDFILKSDTLRIYEISNVQLKGKKWIKEKKDLFLGIIIKADTNEIIINKIEGHFPLKYETSAGNFDNSQIIKFSNQQIRKKEGVNFNYVSIASSICYGNCPAFHLELDNKRNLKFSCTSDCKKIGDFQGVISRDEMKKIENTISYLNLNNDSTVFISPCDASEKVVKINVNNKEYYFQGTRRDFQFKMNVLIEELIEISEKSNLKKSNHKLKYKANIELPPLDEIMQFVPPLKD